jgi:2-oxoglutarate ferredoxin oxidoreductase subunit beta
LVVVNATDERVLTHDATLQDPTLHRMLAMMGQENDTTLPIALGVIRDVEEESYDMAVNQQINEVRKQSKATCFDELTSTLEQWEI